MQSKHIAKTKTSLMFRHTPRALSGSLQDCAYKYFLATDEKAFKAILRKFSIYDSDYLPTGALACCTIYEEQGLAVVCLKEDLPLSTEDIYCLLVHEAVHLWQAHCRWLGEDKPGEETEAYAIQKIAGELIKEYGKSKLSVIKLAKEGVSGCHQIQNCSSGTALWQEPLVSSIVADRGIELP